MSLNKKLLKDALEAYANTQLVLMAGAVEVAAKECVIELEDTKAGSTPHKKIKALGDLVEVVQQQLHIYKVLLSDLDEVRQL